MASRTPDRLPSVPRFWTPEEADRRLPSLRELLGQLQQWARRLAEVRSELDRLEQFWGPEIGAADHPDSELAARLERERGRLHGHLEEAVGALHGEGIDVKDLAEGLVDFFGYRDGEVVLYCWKLGEGQVGFFHSLTDGFAGRRALPARPRSTDPTPPR